MNRAALILVAAGLIALLAWITLREDEIAEGPGGEERPRVNERAAPRDPGVPDAPGERREKDVEPAAPTSGVVSGTVLDPGGAPFRGAQVNLAPENEDFGRTGETDERGEFRITVPPGERLVRITTPDFLPYVARVRVPIDLGTIRLTHGFEITGRVVDAEGVGVGGVVVTESLAEKAVTTGEDGRFRLAGLPRILVRLHASGTEVRMKGDDPEVTPPAAEVTLVVERLRLGAGSVVAEADGKPIEGATVRLTLSTGGWSQIQTGATGVFAFDLTDARYSDPRIRFTVLVTAPGFEDATVEDLTLAQVRPAAKLEVKLVRAVAVEPGSLRGRVLYDTGAPFHGSLTLSFSREGKAGEIVSIETNEKGEFFVEKVTPGEYVLRSAPHGESILRETGKTLRIPPGGEETTEFTLTRGGDVRVLVNDSTGAAAKDYEVAVLDDAGAVARRFRVGSGAVLIPDLVPGKARIRVTKSGYRTEETEVTVIKDQATDATVRLIEIR